MIYVSLCQKLAFFLHIIMPVLDKNFHLDHFLSPLQWQTTAHMYIVHVRETVQYVILQQQRKWWM